MSSRRIDMQCWKCGREIRHLLLPFSRQEECSHCRADLHACKACRHFDSRIAQACREDRADFVLEKERANFCDYFQPNTRAFRQQDNAGARAARTQLAELFGEEPPSDGEQDDQSIPLSESDQALAELKRLFGDD